MKKFLSILGTGLGIIIGVPITLVVCVGYLLFVPFDIIRYHRMPYYKDFKIKYQFFITSRDVVKIYNRIVREQLPIEYVKNNDFEYFVKETLENEADLLKPEHKCLPAKFLVFYNDITDGEKFEQAKECPYFHCVFSVDEEI